MSVQDEKRQEFAFTGKHMLFCMISFFGVIIAVNFTMAYLAAGSWTGLVVKNSYVASQKFNTSLEKAEAQRQAGLSSKLAYESGTLRLELNDREGVLANTYPLVADIGRPAFEQADRTLAFVESGSWAYALDIDLDPGIWQITIRSEAPEFSYRRDARIFIAADGEGHIE